MTTGIKAFNPMGFIGTAFKLSLVAVVAIPVALIGTYVVSRVAIQDKLEERQIRVPSVKPISWVVSKLPHQKPLEHRSLIKK